MKKITGFSVGITHNKESFVAMLLKMKPDDSEALLTSWPLSMCGRAVHILAEYKEYLIHIGLKTHIDAVSDSIKNSAPVITEQETATPDPATVVTDVKGHANAKNELILSIKQNRFVEPLQFLLSPDQSEYLATQITKTLQVFDTAGGIPQALRPLFTTHLK